MIQLHYQSCQFKYDNCYILKPSSLASSGFHTGNQTVQSVRNTRQQVRNISKAELDSILDTADRLNRGDKIQRVRLLKLLAKKPGAITSEIRNTALIGNISDVASDINDLLEPSGYLVGSEQGEVVKDHFGSNHTLYHWFLYRTTPNNQPQAQAQTVGGAF